MTNMPCRVIRRAAFLGAVLLFGSQAAAQTASEVTPGSFRPELRTLTGAIVFSGEPGTQAPPGSESIGITLSGVQITGARAELAEANAALEERLTGRQIPVSELFEATSDLEEAYVNAGLVLTRVVLPQQALRDGGVLRVEVVNGFVETIDDVAVPDEVRTRVGRLVEPLVGRPGVTLAELERQLLLAGDVSGVALNTALATGETQGGTVLALDVQYQRVTSFFSYDNFPDKALGEPTLNFGTEVNSALGFGETLYLRVSATPQRGFSDDPLYRVGAVGAIFPVGRSGLTANLEVTRSVTNPEDTEDTVVSTSSSFGRESLRLIYPWIRSRNINLNAQIAFDHQTDEQETEFAQIYEDDINVLRLTANGSYQHNDRTTSEAGLTVSRGLDILDAREGTTELPLSRDGAEPVFTTLSGSYRFQRGFDNDYALSINARAQASFGDTVVASEQFSAVGAGDLSTFDSGSLRGDSGATLRTEFSRGFNGQLGGEPFVIAPYIFAAAGALRLNNPTGVEESEDSAASVGIGFDYFVLGDTPFRADNMRIEFGRGFSENDGNQNRLSISASLRF
ncbi:ShlB/FhaC/HecB family hemolysin secretion/activation protein [Cognatiyoonia sp. IB215182]|nr:ShlB/FhaC/HecB family hemolysin secretion/activation protein [Cognatiyoonia sp. IB215182]